MLAALPASQARSARLADRALAVLSFGMVATLACTPTATQSVDGFYKGKTVTAIVGSGVGSGYDATMRLL